MLKLEKPQRVKELGDMIGGYSVIALLSMHKLPGRQLQAIRDSLRSKAAIKMSKKTVIERTIKNSKKENISELLRYLRTEPALLLSNESSFKLYSLIKEARSPAAAKANDIAPKDIIIQKGSTNLPAGPAISTLQKVGLKTTVQNGKIAVQQDKVVVKAGERISEDVAGVMSLLKMEPMEIGIELIVAYEDGVVYEKGVLDVDKETYMKDLQKCVSEAINLSVNAGYPTPETVGIMLAKAFAEAKTLCTEAGIIEKEFIGDLIAKAYRELKELEKHAGG